MNRLLKYSAITLLALVTAVPVASARGFGGGGFRGGFGFRGGYAVGVYPGWGWGYPGYGWYGRWYRPGYYVPNAGEVEIKTKQKDNQVFVDGGFAGLTGQLKSFPLRPGTHTIELRNAQGRSFYQERITVIAGKKIKIQSDYAG